MNSETRLLLTSHLWVTRKSPRYYWTMAPIQMRRRKPKSTRWGRPCGPEISSWSSYFLPPEPEPNLTNCGSNCKQVVLQARRWRRCSRATESRGPHVAELSRTKGTCAPRIHYPQRVLTASHAAASTGDEGTERGLYGATG